MSTPEQPANPPLTRKQMREIRNTGSTPVITADAVADAVADVEAPVEEAAHAETADELSPAPAAETVPDSPPPAAEVAPTPAPVVVAHLARAADPVPVAPAPIADASVDLGASPLTRRQARQQERIRTASVPVITPELAAAHTAAVAAVATTAPAPALTRDEPVSVHSGMHDLFGLAATAAPARPAVTEAAEAPADDEVDVEVESPWSDLASEDEIAPEPTERVVNPKLGAGLLEAEPEPVELPASFDQLLARSTGSISMPNALILSQAPEVAPMSAPMSATGEVLITGTLNLPEGLGSTGHALGTADGKEVDATLVDGELPAHSSPTPIAASAAISTVKTAGEVIKPPVPEKGSKLMLALAITAGALALALVGVLILAFVTGAL